MRAFGIAAGAVASVLAGGATLLLVLAPAAVAVPTGVRALLFGYEVSPAGVVIGAMWAYVYGFAAGAVFAFAYNLAAAPSQPPPEPADAAPQGDDGTEASPGSPPVEVPDASRREQEAGARRAP